MNKKLPRTLALETSSPHLSLALGEGAAIAAYWASDHQWRHAESLVQGIETILRQKRWALQGLKGIAVSVGPGSFTGIRIGLSAARALGQFLRVPVVGVSALETLAAGVAQPGVIAPVIDGMQAQVFAGFFLRTADGRQKRLLADCRLPRLAWEETCASMRKKYKAVHALEAGTFNAYPRADQLLKLALPRLEKARPDSFKRVLPLYLRDASSVERLKANR